MIPTETPMEYQAHCTNLPRIAELERTKNIIIAIELVLLLFIVLFGFELLLTTIYPSNRKNKISLQKCAVISLGIWVVGIIVTVITTTCGQACNPKRGLTISLQGVHIVTALLCLFVYVRLYFLIKHKRRRIISPGFTIEQLKEAKQCMHTRYRVFSIIFLVYVTLLMPPVLVFTLFSVTATRIFYNFVLIPSITIGLIFIAITYVRCQKHLRKCMAKLLQCSRTDFG